MSEREDALEEGDAGEDDVTCCTGWLPRNATLLRHVTSHTRQSPPYRVAIIALASCTLCCATTLVVLNSKGSLDCSTPPPLPPPPPNPKPKHWTLDDSFLVPQPFPDPHFPPTPEGDDVVSSGG
jgi:hypothetical protein